MTIKCRKCGGNLFYEVTRVWGPWTALVDGDGEVIDTDLDRLKYGARPKTAKCADCGTRNPNPMLPANQQGPK